MEVLRFILIVILIIQVEIGEASDPFPLSNIMLEGMRSGNPLQCVGFKEACGPAYWCCGTCYCDFVWSAGRFQCTTKAFDTWCG
ncbi:unnamed protein product [Amaranthus hypochondriacus]